MNTIDVIIISDSTGETGEQIVNAAVAQFENVEPVIKKYSHVRNIKIIREILEEIENVNQTIVYYSLVDTHLIEFINKFCDMNNIQCVDILTSAIVTIERITDQVPKSKAGALRAMDDNYFKRIDAIEFAVRYDDGKDPRGVLRSDLTIIGVSRTSKTPLSMYLANKNLRVCNIPLVPESPAPKEIFEVDNKKIIGLTNSPEKLNQIRKERLKSLGLPGNSSYSDMERILEELDYADRIMRKIGCLIIDVSGRAIEETAEVIIRHLRKLQN